MLDLDYLQRLRDKYADEFASKVHNFELRSKHFEFDVRPHTMGVINLSADSWYRETVSLSLDSALQRGRTLMAHGADLIDIGAESTLAHAARVDQVTQQSKLLPLITTLSEEGARISVETYHPSVTEAALDEGACVLNLTGTENLEEHFKIVADYGAAVIICYVQGTNVREVADFEFAEDIVSSMYEWFGPKVALAEKCGVKKIFIDPGLGFYYQNLQDSAVRVRHQMEVFLNTFRLRKLGWPTCHALPHAFEYFREEVRCAEPFMAVLALLGKTDLIRTHELPRINAVIETLRVFSAK
ncbi:MAG: dihydropteroate synthase [Verrucomicrobiota bacterium]|nr:dihydropteroate synthase [Verrucomicrobiota bacterium]